VAAFAVAFFGATAFAVAALAGLAALFAVAFTALGLSGSFGSFGAAAFFVAALTGLGSSGCSGRVRPSFSARRRRRSPCASMSVDE
jgi:hypothetical protein